MLNIALIVGSTRPNRFADTSAEWITSGARARREFNLEVLDLRTHPLPFFNEPAPVIYTGGRYMEPAAEAWRLAVGRYDAFIATVSEYKLEMVKRERYVSSEEFEAVYAKAPENVRIAMDLGLLTGLRRGDLLSLTRSDCKDDGIHCRTSKTGVALIFEWTPELKAVVERAKKLKPRFRTHLIARGKAMLSREMVSRPCSVVRCAARRRQRRSSRNSRSTICARSRRAIRRT